MTIGIAARGPNAGLAVFKALRAAERVGTGSIGGFATYAAITAEGKLLRHQTQRGGSRTLFLDGERTGVEPPPEVAAAISAGVISSGPERPDVEKLLVADGSVGLVTGHRLPIQVGVDGLPLNQQVLDLMAKGHSAQAAIDTVIDRNPEADAGLIAIDAHGGVYGRNTARVLRRPDLAEGRATAGDGEASVVVFYNTIRPYGALAGLVTAIALDTMLGVPKPDAYVTVNAGISCARGQRERHPLRPGRRRQPLDDRRPGDLAGPSPRRGHLARLARLCRRSPRGAFDAGGADHGGGRQAPGDERTDVRAVRLPPRRRLTRPDRWPDLGSP